MVLHGLLGSSSKQGWQSNDTVTAPENKVFKSRPERFTAEEKKRYAEDSELSPRSRPPSRTADPDIAPWDQEPANGSAQHGTGLSDLSGVKSIEDFPEPQWGSMSTQSNGDWSPTRSPSFPSLMHPGTASDAYSPTHERRPSVASGMTEDSQTSIRYQNKTLNKIHSFFGDDPDAERSSSQSNLHVPASPNSHHADKKPGYSRQLSWTSNKKDTKSSPDASRSRTPPQASSEVTPWAFQERSDIDSIGDAPVRDDLSGPDRERYADRRQSTFPSHKQSSHSHRRLDSIFHRHQRSSDSSTSDGRQNLTAAVQRRETQPVFSSMRQTSNATSPRPGSSTDNHEGGSGGTRAPKRTALDKVLGRKKEQRADPLSALRSATGSNASLPLQANPSTSNDVQPPPMASHSDSPALGPTISRTATSASRQSVSQATPKREHHRPHLPFHTSKRNLTNEQPPTSFPSPSTEPLRNTSLFELDTDLSQMDDIVSNQTKAATPGTVAPQTPQPTGEGEEQSAVAGSWDAPDSWAVKTTADENMGKMQELDEGDVLRTETDSDTQWGIRVFRPDNTFCTLTARLTATTVEVIQSYAKKNMLQENLDHYQIILRKHNTLRQLGAGERPLLIQKRLLEQVGYNESDHIDIIGREDHSYLCQFSLRPAKAAGFASHDQDPGFGKHEQVRTTDLSGRKLVTIPLQLYGRGGDIQTLVLSRNLSIDVPKDFIQACTNLKKISYCGNEASKLPPSFCLANRLVTLDVSNNRLEQLDHAQLEKIEGLCSLGLANNRLSRLPTEYSSFRSLRKMYLSSNSFMEIPEPILSIESLTDLDVSFNQISNLSQIGRLQHLRTLAATNNRLAGPLDSSMSRLSKLEELDVRFNEIENIDVCASILELTHLRAGHNLIAVFNQSLPKICELRLDHNPITKFTLQAPSPSMTILDLASASLTHLPDDLFQSIPNLTTLNLNKNHFVSISAQIGTLQKLDKLNIAANSLTGIPQEIGRLSALKILDIRQNNLISLPSELWLCRSLETLNASCNSLEVFPNPPTSIPAVGEEPTTPTSYFGPNAGTLDEAGSDAESEARDNVGQLGDRSTQRRASQLSYGSNESSQGPNTRKNSLVSTAGPAGDRFRKPSVLSRSSTETTLAGINRKESVALNRVTSMCVGSLKYLYLAENRLPEDVLEQIGMFQELEILHLSYNYVDDVPVHSFRRLKRLEELHLSSNSLTSLPSEDLGEMENLRLLFINGNRFQALPADLGKLTKLTVLDASSNMLKYNVCNWPYDWNWNANPQLKYLNLSGNKRLEIRPPPAKSKADEPDGPHDHLRLTDFNALSNLKVLGLMDVTILTNSIPDNTADRRVRTSGSSIGSMAYGIADSFGSKEEHVSTMDIIVPKLEGHEDEILFGLFDGLPSASGGSKSVKFLQDNFEATLREELRRSKASKEDPADAMRRSYLALNKNLATIALQDPKTKTGRSEPKLSSLVKAITPGDLQNGCVATVMYLHGTTLLVSNVGDAQAMMVGSEGKAVFITEKHDPASLTERHRIRDAGGFVSGQGKLNDELPVSRAFGFTSQMPSVTAAPYTRSIDVEEKDELVIIASRDLWNYVAPDVVADYARSERSDLMRASQRLRDLAIAFGAPRKVTVMVVGISDLRKREKPRYRSHSLSLGPSGLSDDYAAPKSRRKRGREATIDSKLSRLDREVDAPTGDVTLVFTDIKSSTKLWELFPQAMRSGIRQHNELFRKQLRVIGGYEVKTEGDAFMVAFPSVTSALLWAFTVQTLLLEVPWPQEILHSLIGQEEKDTDGNILFRGLSVRMGIHWGQPVCETDPVTRRMDYFGPMVNRAARISGVADGGQITVSSDFIGEIQRLLETHIESDRSSSVGSEEHANEEYLSESIRKELRSLSSHGFEVKDLGERRLKGLENLEYIYLMYPVSLAGRLLIQEQRDAAEKASASAAHRARDMNLSVDLENVWDLWSVSLRLEMLCSTLENPNSHHLKPPETALLEMTKERGEVITEQFLLNFVEHQVSRIETCITTLYLRNMVRPFKDGMLDHGCGMGQIFTELSLQLEELKAYKENNDIDMAPS